MHFINLVSSRQGFDNLDMIVLDTENLLLPSLMTYFTNLVSPRQDIARIRTVTSRHPTLTPSHLSALTNIQTLQSVMGGGNKKMKVTIFSWDGKVQTSILPLKQPQPPAAYLGQFLQDEENEQNMSIFLTFTVTKCFDFFYL